MKPLFLLTAALLITSLSPCLMAKEEAKLTPAKLAEFKLGPLLSGEQASLDQLSGKVVVLEFWGVNCGPCLAAMPTFVDMDKRYGKKGVQIVGVHCQSEPDDKVKKTVEKLKMKFPVVNQSSVPSAHSFSGIPHTFVFNPAGDLVYSGHPGDEMEKVVRKEMKGVDAATAATTPAASPAKPITATASPNSPKASASATAAPLIPTRAWANTEGKIMEAALLRVDGDTGKFKSPNGQTFSLAISKLSEADQNYISKHTAH